VLRERTVAFAARNPPGYNLANTDGQAPVDTVSSIEKFASFMRYLAPPTPSPDTPGGAESIARGRHLFGGVGCAACHTPTFFTGDAAGAALSNQPVNLYSDLLLHDMGSGLADGIAQGQAGPREFRTAPLWGLGQRIYFLHDGRTRDLVTAIKAHRGPSDGDASEADTVIGHLRRSRRAGTTPSIFCGPFDRAGQVGALFVALAQSNARFDYRFAALARPHTRTGSSSASGGG
jgi:mono/diheme cytochrome c family protein